MLPGLSYEPICGLRAINKSNQRPGPVPKSFVAPKSPQLFLVAATTFGEMPPEHDQESRLESCTPHDPEQDIVSSKLTLLRRTSAPPPYSGPPKPNIPEDPYAVTLKPPQLAGRLEAPHRPLPALPEAETATFVEPPIFRLSQPISRVQVAGSPSPLPQSTPLPPIITSSPSMYSLSPSPLSSSSSQISPVSQSTRTSNFRSTFRPFNRLKLSKGTRNATAQITDAARQAAEEAARKQEETARQAAARDETKEAVRSSILSLLFSPPSDEERTSVFSMCGQICKNGGLKFSTVLQEPLIEGQTPVYWAILNRPRASSQDDDAAWDALVVALLDECGSLSETTVTSVRLACMLTSNNALLQYLFWQFRALSPLSSSDIMMLRPLGGGDAVDVEETQDGTGTFVAHIKMRRFRMRMRVSKCVKVEFVTSERIWTIAFSTTERTANGRSETIWLLSLWLAYNSTPAWVDADLFVSGRPQEANHPDAHEPIFVVPLGSNARELKPGPENAIKVRLDNLPMGPHLLNESSALVDSDETLHAQFNARLTQPTLPPLGLDILTTMTISSHSEPSPPSRATRKGKKAQVEKEKPVFTSLRRGGR
ncbi:hypothetical protein BJV78DRAFT_1191888 [Lactifluus subvellereus]|nr:hypothetical protein BJV78DRAFT_1191888 [Lactifluus subvellereus]